MSRFDEFVQIVLVEEGPLSNDQYDPGGLTKFGIAQTKHPNVDVENLTRDEAIEIYRTEYWNLVRGDDLPPPLDIVVADMAVNQGVVPAIKTLQLALKIHVDGIMGPVTVAAAQASKSPDTEIDFFARRGVLYAWDVGFSRDGHGWLRRCFSLAVRLLG